MGIINGIVAYVAITIANPGFPQHFLLFKICIGDAENTMSENDIFKNMLISISTLILVAIFTLLWQLRVGNFRRQHGPSYFCQRQQNLVTLNQTFAACHLHVFLHVVSMIFRYSAYRSQPLVSPSLLGVYFFRLEKLLLSFALPLLWGVSAWFNFPELWSDKLPNVPGRRNLVKRESRAGSLVPRGAHATYRPSNQPVQKTLYRREAYAPHRETDATSSTIIYVKECRESQMTPPPPVQAEKISCAKNYEGSEKEGKCERQFEHNGDIEKIRTVDNNGSIAMHLANNFSETGTGCRRKQAKRKDRRKTTKRKKSDNCTKIDSGGKVGHFESPGENGPAKEDRQNNGIYCYSFTLR